MTIDDVGNVVFTMIDETGIRLGIQAAVIKAMCLNANHYENHPSDYEKHFKDCCSAVESALRCWIEDARRIQFVIDLKTGTIEVIGRSSR